MRALIIVGAGVLVAAIIAIVPWVWMKVQTWRAWRKYDQARHLKALACQDLREVLGDDVIVSFLRETHRTAIQRFLHKHDKEGDRENTS